MTLLVKSAIVGIVLASSILLSLPTHAQTSDELITGIITSIETDSNGTLDSFTIVDADGETTEVKVSDQSPNTSYGLENQVGDRWVSDHASESKEAASRIRDQQRRLARITISLNREGVATSVVQAESSDIDSNLGYLFATLAITWIAFAAYIVYMSRRQSLIASDIRRLSDDKEHD